MKNTLGLSEECVTRNGRICKRGLECQGYVGVRNPMSKGKTMRQGYDVMTGSCQPSE